MYVFVCLVVVAVVVIASVAATAVVFAVLAMTVVKDELSPLFLPKKKVATF